MVQFSRNKIPRLFLIDIDFYLNDIFSDKSALESLVGRKSEMKGDEEEGKALCSEDQEDVQKKKPRRKDTPVLNSPPRIPGQHT